jgi:hypothetical protein
MTGSGVRVPLAAPFLIVCVDGHEGFPDDQIFARHSASSHRLRSLRAERAAGSGLRAGCVAVLPGSDGPGRPDYSDVLEAAPRAAEQNLREGFDGSRAVTNHRHSGMRHLAQARNP